MLDAKLADDIVAAVDAGFTDQVKLTQDLVRYPSLRGQEHTAQDFLHNEMARRGLDIAQRRLELLQSFEQPKRTRELTERRTKAEQGVEEARGKLTRRASREGGKPTPRAFVVRACSIALAAHPQLNASLAESGCALAKP